MCRETFCFRLQENISIVSICLRYRWRCNSALQVYRQQFEYRSEDSAGYWFLNCLFKFVQIFQAQHLQIDAEVSAAQLAVNMNLFLL